MPHRNDHSNILVSTIIPTYKKPELLEKALFSALSQTHSNQEIIIINDCPTEELIDKIETLKIIDPRVKVFHNSENKWVSYSRNRWISLSAWEKLAFLDADDIRIDQNKLQEQLSHLEADKNIGLIGTQFSYIDEQDKIIYQKVLPSSDADIRRMVNFDMPILQSSMMSPKAALHKVWMYNEKMLHGEDYDLVYRLGTIWTLANTNRYSTLYRVNDGLCKKYSASIPYSSLKMLIKNWWQYPRYLRAILFKLAWRIPYAKLRPYLSDELVAIVKNARDEVLHTFSNQSYNRTISQDSDMLQQHVHQQE
jgi:glycosyltransferase involved in cell wall biosynthesis